MGIRKKRSVPGRTRAIIAILVNTFIIAAIAAMSVFVYREMLEVEEKRCWSILEDSVETIEKEIKMQYNSNINILKLVSGAMIREQRTEDSENNVKAIVSHLNDFQHMTIFERIDVLLANNNMILQTGEVRSSTMDFNAIAAKGVSLSGRRTDVETGHEVFRCSVPVVVDGKTEAILLGVVNCETLPQVFNSTAYDGAAMVCLVDRASGDFIMDNWHDKLGNVYEMKPRKTLPGYESIDVREEVAQGRTGMIAYESGVNGKASYMYYKPFNNPDWQILVVVQENAVFSSLNTLERLLGYLISIIGFMLIGYFAWSVLSLRNALRKAEESAKQSFIDSLTGLYNQNKFTQTLDEYELLGVKGIGLLFLDLNGLKHTNDHFGHAAGDQLLKNTAKILHDIFGEAAFRVGGDEFVVLLSGLSREVFEALCADAKVRMQEKHIEVAAGIMWQENSGSIRALLKEADDLMYIDKRLYHEGQ